MPTLWCVGMAVLRWERAMAFRVPMTLTDLESILARYPELVPRDALRQAVEMIKWRDAEVVSLRSQLATADQQLAARNLADLNPSASVARVQSTIAIVSDVLRDSHPEIAARLGEAWHHIAGALSTHAAEIERLKADQHELVGERDFALGHIAAADQARADAIAERTKAEGELDRLRAAVEGVGAAMGEVAERVAAVRHRTLAPDQAMEEIKNITDDVMASGNHVAAALRARVEAPEGSLRRLASHHGAVSSTDCEEYHAAIRDLAPSPALSVARAFTAAFVPLLDESVNAADHIGEPNEMVALADKALNHIACLAAEGPDVYQHVGKLLEDIAKEASAALRKLREAKP